MQTMSMSISILSTKWHGIRLKSSLLEKKEKFPNFISDHYPTQYEIISKVIRNLVVITCFTIKSKNHTVCKASSR